MNTIQVLAKTEKLNESSSDVMTSLKIHPPGKGGPLPHTAGGTLPMPLGSGQPLGCTEKLQVQSKSIAYDSNSVGRSIHRSSSPAAPTPALMLLVKGALRDRNVLHFFFMSCL